MKKIYRRFIKSLKEGIIKIEILKIYIFEIIAIYKKRNLYKHIKWTREQQKEFDKFWIENYGKKIPNYWHKLYQSINEVFNIEYIPEVLYTTRLEYKLNDYYKAKVFSDKGFYDILLKNELNNSWRLPKTYLVKYKDIIYNANREIISEKEAREIIGNIKECVIKPTIDTSSGEGVKVLKTQKEIVENFFKNKEYKYSIIQEKLSQQKDLYNLNPASINTFRITTYIYGNKIEICPIALRIGSGNNFLDNIHAGGMGIYVTNDGYLAEDAYVLGWGDSSKKIKEHPDTKIIFKGYKIENIDKVIRSVKLLHKRIPEIRIVSWDVCIDENGIPVIIEANLLGQGSWFPQIISGKSLFTENTKEILKLFGRKR